MAQLLDIGFVHYSWRNCLRLSLLAGAASGLALAVPAFAQSAAPPTRGELTPAPSLVDDRKAPTLTVDGEMERRACALDNPDYADLTVTLNEVSYVGAERAADVALAEAHRGYLGRALPVRALCDIRDRAAALLDEAGYLAAVEIPAQSLGDGRAEMRVVLGRLVAVRARGDTQGSEKLLAGYLGKLTGQDVFNVKAAERYLLLANDVPGTQVRLSLRPAANGAPGDLVGEIAVLRQKAAVDLNIQNYGSRALGRVAGSVRAEAYGLLGAGDRTSITAFTSSDFDEQQTLQFAHDMRLGSEGLTLGGQLTLAWTEPSAIPGFTVKSETVFGTLEARYPLLRTQGASVWGSFGVDLVNQDVDVNGFALTRDRVRTGFARANFVLVDEDSIARRGGYSLFEPKARLGGTVELRQGLGAFGSSPDCRTDLTPCLGAGAVPPSRIEQNPTPLFLRGNVSGEYRPVPLITLAFDLEGQLSGAPLSGFEEFAAGNFGIGRGFDPGAILGDTGVGGSLELRYGSLRPDSRSDLALQPYLFTDLATTSDEDPSAALLDADQLWSVGGGMRFVRGNSMQGDVTLAVPVRRTDTQFQKGDVRLLFTLTTRLFPWSF